MPTYRTTYFGADGIDYTPLLEQLRQLVADDNATAILTGKDCQDRDVAPLKFSTRARRRRGTGPPRAPRRGDSRMVAHLEVEVTVQGNQITVVKQWPEDWVHWHVVGTPDMAARDPSGIRPATDRTIRDLIRNFRGPRAD
jgi:hypothetical protein